VAFLLIASTSLAFAPFSPSFMARRALYADVDVKFPNGKTVKAASGSLLKDAAAKAGFKPNYGCTEGKCGSCELKNNGKTKIRPCIAKVPAAGPCVLTNP